MFDSQQDDATRVGLWIVAVAALAGLIVLLLQDSAAAAQPTSAVDLARMLAERGPLSAEERLQAAEGVLRDARQDRLRGAAGAVLDTGWRVASGDPARGLWRGVRRLASEFGRLRSRPVAEDEALVLLEVGRLAGQTSPRLEALYTDLREREQRDHAAARLDGAEAALRAGHLRLARIRAQRSLDLDPNSERARELVDRATPSAPAPAVEVGAFAVRDWEPALAAALLVEDYERALESRVAHPEAELARAVARHLSGDRGGARSTFEALAARDDALGSSAKEWLALDSREELGLAPGVATDALGWLGGEHLAERGLELSSRSYRAWRGAIEPTNLLISAPVRLARRWRPKRSELVGRSATAEMAGEQGQGATPASWMDGHFVLPPARTRYTALAPRPVLLTRAVLESEAVRELEPMRAALGEAPAVRLALDAKGEIALPADQALALIDDLSLALEQRIIRSHESGGESVLDALRRLDRAVRAGMPLAVEPWTPDGPSAVESLESAALSGSGRGNRVSIQRGRDDVRLATSFGRAAFACPDQTVCLDRERVFSGSLYGRLELDADFRIGARTSFKRASVALEVGPLGPQASIVLPLAHWLRVERWIPLEARLSVGLEKLSFDPVLR